MCVAIYKPAGVGVPSRNMLEHLWKKNNDGGGFCFADGKGVHGYKGFMERDDFMFNLNRRIKRAFPALIHLRIATHGGTRPGATHPFPAESDISNLNATEWRSAFGVVHNGVFLSYGQSNHIKGNNEPLSDTQEFIAKILSDRVLLYSLFSQRNSAARTLLNKEINGSRVALLRFDGRCELLGNWEKAGPFMYSNMDFRQVPSADKRKRHHKDACKEKGKKYVAPKYVWPVRVAGEDNWTENIIKKYDPFLKRVVPHNKTTGVRIDHLIECPSCKTMTGVPVMKNGIEMCSICCGGSFSVANRRDEEDMMSHYEEIKCLECKSGRAFIASDLAHPIKGAKKIREVLEREYGLVYCISLEAFIPGGLCEDCINFANDASGDRRTACYTEEVARMDNKKFAQEMRKCSNAFCYPDACSLGDIPTGDELDIDTITRRHGINHVGDRKHLS
jgi:hypothetical protein